MAEYNNILLITDYEDIAKSLLEKLVLLRENDSITICSTNNIKKTLANSISYIIILHELENENATLRMINTIKENSEESEIILLLNETNRDFVLKAYDEGVYDFFTLETEAFEILIKLINCFKLRIQKELNSRNEKFLYQMGVIETKTDMYEYKHLKEIFLDISEKKRIQNGFFVILTLDEKTKTKISTNRLAQIIKNSIRIDDIASVARGGKFYLILPNIDFEGTKALIKKIQTKMGEDFKIRAGLSKIGIQSFETLDKLTKDSLEAALQKNEMCASFDNLDNQLDWLEDDTTEPKKDYKLFRKIFDNKINNIITPLFFRYQKDYETKLTNTQVSQYANDIECVFSLKNELVHSELIIRYNGYAKFNLELIHSGLDSPENFKTEIPIKSMTNKYLQSLLKRLKDEYKQAAYKKED